MLFRSIRHDGALALGQLLRRLRRRLHLHDALLAELFEVIPAESLAQSVGPGHDGAAVAWMGLDDSVAPLRIEKIRVAFWGILFFHLTCVVADHREMCAIGCELSLGVLDLSRP